jgi:hypothetical protein
METQFKEDAVETHPQQAEDMPIGNADLSALVRTIDPVLDQLIDGAVKGALHADDVVDIAVRIRSILHEAVARQQTPDVAPAADFALASEAGG